MAVQRDCCLLRGVLGASMTVRSALGAAVSRVPPERRAPTQGIGGSIEALAVSARKANETAAC